MINFHVDDPDAFTGHVSALGVVWKRHFEPEAFGIMATLEDPTPTAANGTWRPDDDLLGLYPDQRTLSRKVDDG